MTTSNATEEELQAGREYETLFVPALFAQWTRHVIDGAGVQEGARVIDIACGSGVLARAAMQRVGAAGRVAGLDPAAGMIAAAKEVEPNIEWVIGAAEDLPFEAEAFDHVISQFGMMFFQDRPKGAREMHRVLNPRGSLAVAIWCAVDQNPAYLDVASVLEREVSAEAANAVKIPFCLGDPAEVVEMFSQAGFEDVTYETRRGQAEFPSTRRMVEVELRGWLPLFGVHLSEEKIADVLARSEDTLSKYATSSGTAVFPTCAYIVSARKSK